MRESTGVPVGGGAAGSATGEAGRRRLAPEWWLLGLAILSVAFGPIELDTVTNGLPAHPLIVHLPVVAIPVAALAAIVLMIRPAWLARWGVAAGIAALLGMVGTFLAAGSGEALQESLGADGDSHLIEEHAEAAETLRLIMFGFLIVFTVTLVVWAARRGSLVLPGPLGRLAEAPWVGWALRVAVVALAVLCLVMVVRVGDLGAQSVWTGEGDAASIASPVLPGSA